MKQENIEKKNPAWVRIHDEPHWGSVGPSEHIKCKDCIFRYYEIDGELLDYPDMGNCQKYVEPKDKPHAVYFDGADCVYYQQDPPQPNTPLTRGQVSVKYFRQGV